MTQRARNLIASILPGLGALTVIVFVVMHSMTTPRPPWSSDLVGLGQVMAIGDGTVRGRRWRWMQTAEHGARCRMEPRRLQAKFAPAHVSVWHEQSHQGLGAGPVDIHLR